MFITNFSKIVRVTVFALLACMPVSVFALKKITTRKMLEKAISNKETREEVLKAWDKRSVVDFQKRIKYVPSLSALESCTCLYASNKIFAQAVTTMQNKIVHLVKNKKNDTGKRSLSIAFFGSGFLLTESIVANAILDALVENSLGHDLAVSLCLIDTQYNDTTLNRRESQSSLEKDCSFKSYISSINQFSQWFARRGEITITYHDSVESFLQKQKSVDVAIEIDMNTNSGDFRRLCAHGVSFDHGICFSFDRLKLDSLVIYKNFLVSCSPKKFEKKSFQSVALDCYITDQHIEKTDKEWREECKKCGTAPAMGIYAQVVFDRIGDETVKGGIIADILALKKAHLPSINSYIGEFCDTFYGIESTINPLLDKLADHKQRELLRKQADEKLAGLKNKVMECCFDDLQNGDIRGYNAFMCRSLVEAYGSHEVLGGEIVSCFMSSISKCLETTKEDDLLYIKKLYMMNLLLEHILVPMVSKGALQEFKTKITETSALVHKLLISYVKREKFTSCMAQFAQQALKCKIDHLRYSPVLVLLRITRACTKIVKKYGTVDDCTLILPVLKQYADSGIKPCVDAFTHRQLAPTIKKKFALTQAEFNPVFVKIRNEAFCVFKQNKDGVKNMNIRYVKSKILVMLLLVAPSQLFSMQFFKWPLKKKDTTRTIMKNKLELKKKTLQKKNVDVRAIIEKFSTLFKKRSVIEMLPLTRQLSSFCELSSCTNCPVHRSPEQFSQAITIMQDFAKKFTITTKKKELRIVFFGGYKLLAEFMVANAISDSILPLGARLRIYLIDPLYPPQENRVKNVSYGTFYTSSVDGADCTKAIKQFVSWFKKERGVKTTTYGSVKEFLDSHKNLLLSSKTVDMVVGIDLEGSTDTNQDFATLCSNRLNKQYGKFFYYDKIVCMGKVLAEQFFVTGSAHDLEKKDLQACMLECFKSTTISKSPLENISLRKDSSYVEVF